MKKIIIIGEPKPDFTHLANSIGECECIVLCNDNAEGEEIEQLLEQQNILKPETIKKPDLSVLCEQIQMPVKSKPSNRNKKWQAPYKFHK